MQGGYIRQERTYVTFAALLVIQKRDERITTFYNLKENKSKFVPTFSTRRACILSKFFRVLRKII